MLELLTLLKHLPTLIVILRRMEARRLELEIDKKVVDDLKEIEEAFERKDEQALRDLFNNK